MAKRRKGVIPHKVQIKQSSFGRADVYIDGKRIKGVQAVDYHIGANEIPQMDITLVGAPNLDGCSNVAFEFTPETVEQAVDVLLRNDESNWIRLDMSKHGISVYLNDVRIPRVERIDAYFDGKPFMDLSDTTRVYISYLREQFIQCKDLYDGLVASIRSVFNEVEEEEIIGHDVLAKRVADRIIGKERSK